MESKIKIPVCKPDITEEDVQAVTDCAKSGWVSGISPYVDRFEKDFAAFCGAPFAVATNSGSTALQLLLAAHGIKRGDEVIVPDFTMVASPNAVVNVGAKPIFVDCEPGTWNIDPEKVSAAITKKTKAIMPVHIYGHPCEMSAINNLAAYYTKNEDQKIVVLDDCAEAFGAKFCGHRVGSFGDGSAFSLYANKTITSGEGGIVTTHSKELAAKMHWLKAQAFGREGRHFYHEALGFGFRMSGLQAALGASQLKRGQKYVDARRAHAKAYMDNLRDLEEQKLLIFPMEKSYAENTYWMFTVLVKKDRDLIINKMAAKGVETRPVFTPMHNQPIYRVPKGDRKFPISAFAGPRGINLPSSNGLTDEEISYVCSALREALQ